MKRWEKPHLFQFLRRRHAEWKKGDQMRLGSYQNDDLLMFLRRIIMASKLHCRKLTYVAY